MSEPTTQAIVDYLRWRASTAHALLLDAEVRDMQLVFGAQKDALLYAADAIESGDVEKFAALVAGSKRAGKLEVPLG